MGGSRNSSPANRSEMVRYAPYIEEKHTNLLGTYADVRADIINDSPYTSYTDQDVISSMFGAGYAIADFPALYNMYGKFMSGYDLESLWDRTFNEQVQMSEVDEAIAATIDVTDDVLISNDIPEFKLAMRDINGVSSSSFVINKASIECSRTKQLAAISAEAKFKLFPDNSAKYNAVLNWQKGTTDTYAVLMKLYYMTAMKGVGADSKFVTANTLWPFTVLDFERAALGTMNQARGYNKTAIDGGMRKRSDLSKALFIASWTVNGAVVGSNFGPPVGTAFGAVVGFCIGTAMIMFE